MPANIADLRRLFFGGGSEAEYNFLKTAADAGATGLALVNTADVEVRKDDGTMTCSASSNDWAPVTAAAGVAVPDLVIPNVVAGQKIRLTPNFVIGAAGAAAVFLDLFTIVASAPVNQIGTDAAGVGTWAAAASTEKSVGARITYTVQAGDIESGSVRFRLYSKINSAAVTRGIAASAGYRYILAGSRPLVSV